MTTRQSAQEIPEPLNTVLRDYLHVEWYELDELAQDIKNPNWRVSVADFKAQLHQAITSESIPFQGVNALTAHEFESAKELQEWLGKVWLELFEDNE